MISNNASSHPTSEHNLPKGIQQNTLELITDYMKEKKGWVNGDQIAEDVGLSNVTVRHYMSYLIEIKKIHGEIKYEHRRKGCQNY